MPLYCLCEHTRVRVQKFWRSSCFGVFAVNEYKPWISSLPPYRGVNCRLVDRNGWSAREQLQGGDRTIAIMNKSARFFSIQLVGFSKKIVLEEDVFR